MIRDGASQMKAGEPWRPRASSVLAELSDTANLKQGVYWSLKRISQDSFQVWISARRSLQEHGCGEPDPEDIASEAVEAAERLGL